MQHFILLLNFESESSHTFLMFEMMFQNFTAGKNIVRM